MSFDASFLAQLKQRVPLHEVIAPYVTWDKHKTNTSKGDYWAPCPFHNEKTASFHVIGARGAYYCFGCQAKGDAITFVSEFEKLPFQQAIEKLAHMAGMTMPARTDRGLIAPPPDKASRGVLEAVQQSFLSNLHSAAGAHALRYTRERGITNDAMTHFGLGYALNERYAVRDALRRAGFNDADGVRAGVLIAPEAGDAPFDRFRDRLIFPIHDAMGKIISFAGRALSAQAQAKYLNGPETTLFYKSDTLFHLHHARRAASKSGRLLVCEGYMDVLALHQVGIADAVAPMGTALTEAQLQLLWRHAPEPLIVFDGDSAGQRAALRALDLALPLLQPGRSLQFVFLPQGQDPDDVVRQGGVAAMQTLLQNAIPLSAFLFKRTFLDQPLDTPERMAAAAVRVKEDLQRIAHEQVRQFYSLDMRQRYAQWRGESVAQHTPLFQAARTRPWQKIPQKPTPPPPPNHGSRAREYMLLGMILAQPELLSHVSEALAALPMHDNMAQHVRGLLLALDSAVKQGNLKQMLVEKWEQGHIAVDHMLGRVPQSFIALSRAQALARWQEEATFHCTRSEMQQELRQATRTFAASDDTQALERVRFLQEALQEQQTSIASDTAAFTKF